MKIKAKYKYHKLIYFPIDDLEYSGKEYYEYIADCWLIGVLPAQEIDYSKDCNERAVIVLGDGVVKVVPLSSVLITDECYFTAPEQEHLIAKYAIDENGYLTGENLLTREEGDK